MSAPHRETSQPVQPKTKSEPLGHIELYSTKYWYVSGLAGAIACGPTHALVCPLDLIKVNVQQNPKLFSSTIGGLRQVYSGSKPTTEMGLAPGLRGIAKGWSPTAVGYAIQGAGKYGFYEYFKHKYTGMVSEQNAAKYRDLIAAGASASAEFLADLGLCPFEALKVRIQTNPKYATGLSDGLPKFVNQEGFGGLYAGLVPLWARQIPYTICKFVAFERIVDGLYDLAPKKKDDMSKVEQMGVVFSAGYLAGIICAVVSHPADTMVSKINAVKGEGSLIQKMQIIYSGDASKNIEGIGFKGLWGGIGTRIVMIGTLTGMQFFLYGAVKAAVGLPTPGGESH